jgi:peptidoglycan/LPS O-acetylase OafA/YrhL
MSYVLIKNREFPEIDFLRFIAILFVVIFHFTSRRAGLLPYGDWVNRFPWDTGWVGVNLFFLISGFIIAHSLNNCKTPKEFIIRRLTRIYPTLWLVLPIVFLASRYVPYSIFNTSANLSNLVISMTLLPPSILGEITNQNLNWITVVLWSLKVEVIFYFFCYLLFKIFGPIFMIARLIQSCVVLSLIYLGASYSNNSTLETLANVIEGLGFDYLPWFVIGVIFYRFKSNKLNLYSGVVMFSTLALFIEFRKQDNFTDLLSLVFIIFLFGASMGQKIPKFISSTFFQRIGQSSYEMYLIHQGVGFPIIYFIITRLNLSNIQSFSIMIFVTTLLFMLSILLFRYTTKVNSMARRFLLKL